MTAVKSLVDSLIAKSTVVIFSKTYCPYCTKAKNVAKELNQPLEIVELDTRDDGADIQNYLLDLTQQRTVPNIFIKGQHVGGCDAFLSAKSSGKVAQLLA